MSNAPTTSAPAVPFPPRHRWLRRIAIAAFVYLLAIFVLRYWVVSVNEARLRAAKDKLKAAGLPVSIEELEVPFVPAEKNAATLLLRAAARVIDANFGMIQRLPGEEFQTSGSIFTFSSQPGRVATNLPIVDALLRANQPALDDVIAGLDLPQTDWRLRAARPATLNLMPLLRGQQKNAELLAVAAVHAHSRDDDATAVEHLHRMLALADRVEVGLLAWGSPLVASQIRILTVRQIEFMLPTLQIAAEGDPQPGRRAPRQRILALIAALSNAMQQRARVDRFLAAGRVIELDTLEFAMEKGLYRALTGVAPRGRHAAVESVRSWITRPAMLRAASHCAARSLAFRNGPEPDASRAYLYPGWPRPLSLLGITLEIESILPSLSRLLAALKRGVAYERMAAVGLAMRLYAIDHGDWPDELERLVPDYLPALPRDPFAATDQTFTRIDTYGWPRLYSVGADGEDDGGWPCSVRTGGSMTQADLTFSIIGRRFDCEAMTAPPHPDRPLWPTPTSSPATSEQPN